MKAHLQSSTKAVAVASAPAELIIPPAESARIVGVHPTTLRRWWQQGHFPLPKRLGPNRIGHWKSEVVQWLEERPRSAPE
jgi:predicted DNA-binding transcriptional regulator AlpA